MILHNISGKDEVAFLSPQLLVAVVFRMRYHGCGNKLGSSQSADNPEVSDSLYIISRIDY